MKTELGQDMLDSRDVIEKFEELTTTKGELEEAVVVAQENYSAAQHRILDYIRTGSNVECESFYESLNKEQDAFVEVLEEAEEALEEFLSDSEYELWKQLVEEGESAPDWSYGECLIRSEYFETYTEALINDCWELPKEMNSGQWPFRHMKFDFSAAADELKDDYIEINVGDYTYFIRG